MNHKLRTLLAATLFPFSMDGEQFVAVPTGYNGGSPEVRPVTMLAYERNRPSSGHAVYVFALPKAVKPGPAAQN